MKFDYVVNSVSNQTRPAVATVNGATMSALVPEVEVELYDPINQHGSIQLHFRTPEEQEYALKTFIPGETASIEF